MSLVIEHVALYLNSVGPALVTVLCLIWLGYRASSLLILPVDQVIRLLNLDVPAVPRVALDAVTSDTISLRWQVPDKQSVSKHLIQLNGSIIGESDKKDTNVIITGLTPNQLCCIRVIAANAQRLHSSSEVIRVRTSPSTRVSAANDAHEHVPVIHTHAPPPEPTPTPPLPPQSRHRLSSARDTPPRRLSNAAKAERIRSNSLSSALQQQPQSTQQQPQSPIPVQPSAANPVQTLESLTQELDRVNRETAEITAQLESEEQRNRTEIATLTAELAALRAKRKEDDDQKANIKAETKALEETKRTVDAQKTKLEKQLKALKDEVLRLEGEESARLQDLAEKEQTLADLCEATGIVEKRAKEARTVGREELAEVQRQISALEESNRMLAQRIAGMKSAAEARDVDEEKIRMKAIDQREDEEDRKVDMEWVESEQALKAKHDVVKAEFDEANREYREALALLVQAREKQPAGHLSAAGSKHRAKKQRSRRGRQKGLNLQSNVSEPSLNTSEVSFSSRPRSLTIPPSNDPGLHYKEYSDPAILPYDYQSSSPWASTHSLGLIRDVPVPPLDTSVDARERERLTGGTLLSPSVSEHLLPSNLFGPDEDSIRTSPYIDKLLESSPHPYKTPVLQTTLPASSLIRGQPPPTDSPISEMSTRSSFSSPNQSHPALPLYADRLIQQETQSSPTIVMTPPPAPPSLFDRTSVIVTEEEPVEVTSPSELNGIPLSAESGENSDEEILQPESSSPLKHWKIPSISFKRKAIPPEKRLPMLGSLKGEKSRSMPRTTAGATPIGFNRPRWGSGSSSGWLTQMTRARAPSETGRQFDTNFDPLESRRLLEGAGVVHHHSSFPSSVDFRTSPTSPRTSFDSRIFERRSTDTEMAARTYMGGTGPVTPSKGSLYRPSSVYSDFSIPYNQWISTAPLSLPTSPSAGIGTPASPILHPSQWSPPNTSRSSLDPKAPEFRTSLQQFITPVESPELAEVADLPKRGASLFSLPRRSTVRQPGDSFMNTFTGLFRRESKINEDEDATAGNELSRPRSQDTQNSGTDRLSMTISGSMEDIGASVEPTPEKKKKEKKKKEKVKGKSLFRWTDSTASTSMAAPMEDPELKSLKSMESIQDQEGDESMSTKKKRKKKEKMKKGVKFEKDVSGDGESFVSGVGGVGTGEHGYEWSI